MYRWFNSNNLGLKLIATSLIIACLRLFVFANYSIPAAQTNQAFTPLVNWLNQVGLFTPNWLSGSIALVLQIIILLTINKLFTHHIDNYKQTHVAILVGLLLLNCLPAFAYLTPHLVVLTLALLALNYVLTQTNNNVVFYANLGLILGIITQFSVAGFFLIIPFIYAVYSTRKANWKQLFVLLYNIGLPFVIYYLFTFAFNIKPAIFYPLGFGHLGVSSFLSLSHIQVAGLIYILLLFAYSFVTIWFLLDKVIQTEKIFFRVAFIWLLSLIIQAFTTNSLNIGLITLISFPLCLYITKALFYFNRKWIPEVITISLFLLLVFGQAYFYLN